MNIPEFKVREKTFSTPKQQHQPVIQQALTSIQNHFSTFLQHVSTSKPSSLNADPFSLKTHLEFTLSSLKDGAKKAIETGIASLNLGSSSSAGKLVWARSASRFDSQIEPIHRSNYGMSYEVIEERLAGVPVYALSNSSEEFVLVSGVNTGKSLGLFCFKKEDADALLEQMKLMDPGMRRGSKVVAVALNKVFQLKVDGVAFRLIPEATQIKNALQERKKGGLAEDDFSGVPVFQSRSLILRSQDKRYRPVFFRKEDLETSLLRASSQQKQLNPVFRQGDIQVAVLEEIIKGMKDSSTSKWDDVVFIPPGFDVSTDPSQQEATANGF